MDEYTQITKNWLEEKYKRYDENGVYFAHQPIYGLRGGHSADHPILRYFNTYAIMKALSHIRFSTLLDVGGSEGYKAALASNLFGIHAQNTDLSEEACKRAEEIFHIKSRPSDIHDLAYENGEFDLVLCSETLEHTTSPQRALNELLRVARRAVVITVPHDNPKNVEANISNGVPHGHIHSFNLDSLDYLRDRGYDIIAQGVFSPLLLFPTFLAEAQKTSIHTNGPFKFYNASVPVLSRVLGNRLSRSSAIILVRMDVPTCKFLNAYNTCIFTIVKDRSCWSEKALTNVSACDIVDFKVPYHYIRALA